MPSRSQVQGCVHTMETNEVKVNRFLIAIEWREFLAYHTGRKTSLQKAFYSILCRSFLEDRMRCMKDAEAGVPKAVELREKFMLWKLTK